MMQKIIRLLLDRRFPLENEKILQSEIGKHLLENLDAPVQSEFKLSAGDTVDFMIQGIGIEVKIKGGRRAIYRQCARYCQYPSIASLILVTNVSMGFPGEINGKNCYLVNLGKAWL